MHISWSPNHFGGRLHSFSQCWRVGGFQLSFPSLGQASGYLCITCQDVCVQQSHAANRLQAGLSQMQLQKIAILHKKIPKSVVVQRKIGASR